MTKLRLYSDRVWLPPGREGAHVTALTPFWGRTNAGSAGWPDYADELIARGGEFLELAPTAEGALAVFPLGGRTLLRDRDGVAGAKAREFAEFARAAGSPTVFFVEPADTRGHLDPPFPVSDAFVFRGSLFRSRRGSREHALPGWHDDLVNAVAGELPIRPKGEPVVSFMGGVIPEPAPPAGVAGRVRRAAGDARRAWWRLQRKYEDDLFVRARAVDALLRQDAVATSLVVRESGGGGSWSEFDRTAWARTRREYVENMLHSDYVLCARGDGNWSLRFYEAMSLGRIPVVIDTDLVMPYEWLVDWREFGVWVTRSEVDRIGERVAEFHDRLSDAEFTDLQRECRALWERYLSPLGFFRNFHAHFDRPAVAHAVTEGLQ